MFVIKSGVRQGGILSSWLFAILTTAAEPAAIKVHDIISRNAAVYKQIKKSQLITADAIYRRQQLLLSGGGYVCLWRSVPACITVGSCSAVYVVDYERRISTNG